MNVVFQGGGIKGLAYVGALRYLEERGIKFKNCAGTSIGAIMASLVICGYTSKELETIIDNMNIDLLWPNKKMNILSKTYKTIKKGSMYSMGTLEFFLDALYREKGIHTFKDVKLGNDYCLKMVTTYLKEMKIVIIPDDLKYFGFNPDSFPIAKAACMSSAIPLVYAPYKLGNYRFIDGGVIDNFPMWLYKDALGLRLSKNRSIINYAQRKFLRSFEDENKNIIFIDTKKYKATDFRKGYNERYFLYNIGYYYTKLFFDNYFRKKLET